MKNESSNEKDRRALSQIEIGLLVIPSSERLLSFRLFLLGFRPFHVSLS